MDPLLEIGFAGKITNTEDRGYALRLSAMSSTQSGVYYRLNGRYHQLAAGSPVRLGAYKRYSVLLESAPGEVRVSLDGVPFVTLPGESLDAGLVSLIAGWHPAYITELEVTGTALENGRPVDVLESGLVPGGEGRS